MIRKTKLQALVMVSPILFASANANAVNISAKFAFSATLMEAFFDTQPVMVIDRYIDSEGHTRPLPAPISIDDHHQFTTPLLDLGDVAPGQDFSIRFLGSYFAVNRLPGAPSVPIPARLRLDFRLLEPQQGTYQIRLQGVWGRNEQHPLPQANQIRAISPQMEGNVEGTDEINPGQRLRIGLNFRAANAVLPALVNQML